jgi:hypothetical protein
MSDAAREHWLDRLAAPQTRAQVLRAALAGAALTLPFARPTATRAAGRKRNQDPCNAKPGKDAHACQNGCFYAAHQQFYSRVDGCSNLSATQFGVSAVTTLLLLNPALLAVKIAAQNLAFDKCREQALVKQKAMAFDCLFPNCPGFDPCGPGGPCVDCSHVENASCCPDTTSVFGYSCCAQCCAPNGVGCGSGVTDCGGSP